MKRRSVSGNVTVEQFHRPGPSEPQLINPISKVKKIRTSSKTNIITYHLTRATRRRVTETENITHSVPKMSKVIEPTEKVELTKKEARALVEQYRYFLG